MSISLTCWWVVVFHAVKQTTNTHINAATRKKHDFSFHDTKHARCQYSRNDETLNVGQPGKYSLYYFVAICVEHLKAHLSSWASVEITPKSVQQLNGSENGVHNFAKCQPIFNITPLSGSSANLLRFLLKKWKYSCRIVTQPNKRLVSIGMLAWTLVFSYACNCNITNISSCILIYGIRSWEDGVIKIPSPTNVWNKHWAGYRPSCQNKIRLAGRIAPNVK